MLKSTNLFLCSSLLLLVSCGGSQPSGPQAPIAQTPVESPSPRSEPESPSTVPQSRAYLTLGSVERSFIERDNAACTLDPNRGEAIILFSEETGGSTLSIRMQHLDLKNPSYRLRGGNSGDSFQINLGGDKSRYNFRLDSSADAYTRSYCQVNYRLNQTILNGDFRCFNLVNRIGQSQEASGEWTCKIQAETQWQW